MTKNEILDLFLEKKKKGLKNKQLAEAIGCSESLLSQFFNFQCNLSTSKEEALKRVIRQAKEYEWRKVEVD